MSNVIEVLVKGKNEAGLEDLLDVFRRYIRPDPSNPSAPNDSGASNRTGQKPPDGSSVRSNSTRPSSSPGNPGLGRVRTVPDSTPPGNPRCSVCGKPNLFHPHSIARGICAACTKEAA
jgi:hypothetical protein